VLGDDAGGNHDRELSLGDDAGGNHDGEPPELSYSSFFFFSAPTARLQRGFSGGNFWPRLSEFGLLFIKSRLVP